jgi:nicotinamidase-related amidase
LKIIEKDNSHLAIDPKRTAILVIDIQEAFIRKNSRFVLKPASKTTTGINALIETGRRLRMKVIFTRVYHDDMAKGIYPSLFPDHFDNGMPLLRKGTELFQISRSMNLRKGDLIIDKPRYSAFYRTELERYLKRNRMDTIIVVGLATNVCCESTVRDAFYRNLRPIVVSDLNSTYSEELQKASLKTMKDCFALVLSSRELQSVLSKFPS